MHPSAYAFATTALTRDEVEGKSVIEAGAYDVNGSAREAIEALGPHSYIGTDMQPGPGVDVVCPAEGLHLQFSQMGDDGTADVVISTEMLEHAEDWAAAMAGMIRVLKPGGLLVLTTRGPGFPRHGYPDDYWRFTPDIMRAILGAAGLETVYCEPDPDPASPGVFVKARKPGGRPGPDGNLTDVLARIEVPGV
jgi:SAM-dependent methyltransferase